MKKFTKKKLILKEIEEWPWTDLYSFFPSPGIDLKKKKKLKNLIKKNEYESIVSHMKYSNLPLKINDYFSLKDLNKILFFMKKDKKNDSDKINLILLKKIGFTKINNFYSTENLNRFLRKELIN